MPMRYRLRQGLSYCLCEGRPIFLDIDSGRYSTVPTPLCSPFVGLMAGDARVAARDIERLLTLRVIEPGAPRPVVALPTPSDELAPVGHRGWAVAAAVAQGLAIRRVRRLSLRSLFAVEAARRPSERAAEEGDLGRLRAAFDRVAALFGEADQCLPRSIAFRRLALQQGHRPSLVIGVKIDPFAAHCWAQTGTRVDNDSIERVRLFTPIQVI